MITISSFKGLKAKFICFNLVLICLVQSTEAQDKRIVNFFNWADYIGEETIKNFQNEFGIKVNYDQYDSSEMVEAKLLSGNSGYDLIIHSSMYSKRLMPLNIFHEIDTSKLKNINLLDPEIMQLMSKFDPGNQVMIPYSYGSTGIAYNADMIFERFPDAPIGSGDMLYDPEVLSKFADCGVSILDSPTDVIPQALIYLGYQDDTKDPNALREAEDLLLGTRPYIKKFTSTTFLNDLPNGDLCLSMSWAGDYATAKMRAKEAGKDVDLRYFVPSEGGLMWVDILLIPNDAPHKENAYLLLDYLLRPEVSADFVNLTHYASPIPAADEFIEKEILDDPAIYPTPDIMKRIQLSEVMQPKYERMRTRAFTRYKIGYKKKQ